jgi:hypothetical protein
MAGPTVDLPPEIQAGAPGVSMVGGNTRVKSPQGFLGTAADVLNFANGAVGSWVVPNTRTRISGVFMVSQSSTGIAQPPGTNPPVPVTVTNGNPNIRSV